MPPKTVLVVDDHEDSRIICGSILRHYGYGVLEVGSGEDALRQARSQRPDLILTDISLPGIDGYQLTACLRQDRETADIPLVALTAMVMPEDRARASTAFDAYLSKPCTPHRVLAEVERIIGPATALVQ